MKLLAILLVLPCCLSFLAFENKHKLEIFPSKTVVEQNTPLNVSWLHSNPNNSHDWIGFWQIGSSPKNDKNYVQFAWQYTYGGQTAFPSTVDASPHKKGTIAVIAPTQPGKYELYYCLNNGYECPAVVEIQVIEANIPSVTCSEKTMSNIEHIILIVTENHSFDSIYGAYCKATAGSDPKCNEGAKCCEAAPEELSGRKAYTLSDAQNLAFDPDHSQTGETCKQDGGKMDNYVGTSCIGSSDDRNFAVADSTSGWLYYALAEEYAIADRCFQSAAGASSENDMYYITGQFLFVDNQVVPQNSDLFGTRCYSSNFASFYNPTVLDLLSECNVSWVNYAEGYGINPNNTQCYPEYFDASDYAASFYKRLTDNPENHWKDLNDLFSDIQKGDLPAYSYIKGLGKNSEHPGISSLSAGENITNYTVNAIISSPLYQNNTLIVLIPDESGGFYDHVSPPPGASPIDGQIYGPRIPLVLIGNMVKKNFVSHVQLEPTSILKFIEWNWLNGETGQLKTRDTIVANLGSLLDREKTGVEVPDF